MLLLSYNPSKDELSLGNILTSVTIFKELVLLGIEIETTSLIIFKLSILILLDFVSSIINRNLLVIKLTPFNSIVSYKLGFSIR